MHNPALLLDQLSTSVLVVDASARILDMNPAAEALLGASATRARNSALTEHLPCVARELATMIEAAIERQVTFAQDLNLLANPYHAEDRIVDCRVTPLPGADTPTAVIEFSDITRRVRVHRENMLLSQHAAGRKMIRKLAHEIKNPLGGMRGAAQLLARQVDAEELTPYTNVIVAEVDRLAGLVDTLLGPDQQSQKKPTNVHDLLEHVARLTEARVASDVAIKRDYDPGLPNLNLDRDQIIQVLLNLVNNALAATAPGRTLILRTAATPNLAIGSRFHRMAVSVSVEDDGPGVPDELRDSIFFPMVTGTDGGTGLGLPLAQELVNRHDGLIEFESRPGRTVFHVRLPIQ